MLTVINIFPSEGMALMRLSPYVWLVSLSVYLPDLCIKPVVVVRGTVDK